MICADKDFADISVGEKASFQKEIDERDVDDFIKVSGDNNPLHADGKYAANMEFKKRVVHGMYLGALVSRLIGTQLPGKRALLLKEALEFKKPVFIGDTVHVSGTVLYKSQSARILEISIEIRREDTTVVKGVVHVRVL